MFTTDPFVASTVAVRHAVNYDFAGVLALAW